MVLTRDRFHTETLDGQIRGAFIDTGHSGNNSKANKGDRKNNEFISC